MKIQLIIAGCFALNMFLMWVTFFIKRCRWYRSVGELIFIILPFTMVSIEQPHFELDFFWWKIAGIASILLGGLILLWTVIEMTKKGIANLDIIPDKFLDSGPFAFVRHPIFLSLIFLCIGWWWVFAAVYSFYFGMLILLLIWLEAYLEEKFILEKAFGARYHEYRQHTGMFWIK